MTTEEPARIAVLGSCITRDSFNSRFNPRYKDFYVCPLIQNQTSIISLMSEPMTLGDDQYGGMTAYDQWNVRTDLNKEFLAKVVDLAPDYLILDFFADIHFGCLQLPDGRYITNNRWKLWQTGFHRELKATDQLAELKLQSDPEAYLELWKASFDRLVGYLRENLPQTAVIVHRGRNTGSLQLPGQSETVDLQQHRKISKLNVPLANALWATLDDYAVNSTGFDVIDLTRREYPTFDGHPWGPFYVHYTLDYYSDFLTALHKIHLTRACGLRAGDLPMRVLADVEKLAAVGPNLAIARLSEQLSGQARPPQAAGKKAPGKKAPAKKTAARNGSDRKAPVSVRTRLKRRVRRGIRRVALLEAGWQRFAPDRRNVAAPASAEPSAMPPVQATLATCRWLGPSTLQLTGWVWAKGVEATETSRPELTIWMEQRAGGRRIGASTRAHVDPEVNVVAKDAKTDHSGAGFTAVLDLASLASPSTGGPWRLRCSLTSEGRASTVAFNGRVMTGSAGRLLPSAEISGNRLLPTWTEEDGLHVEAVAADEVDSTGRLDEATRLLITDVAMMGEPEPDVEITGSFTARGTDRVVDPADLRLELHGTQGVFASRLQMDGDVFETSVPLVVSQWGGRPAPLMQGTYQLRAWLGDEEVPVVLSEPVIERLPVKLTTDRVVATLIRSDQDAPMIVVSPPLRPDELGEHAQAVLQREYARTSVVPDGSVYFESFYGRSATDSPRAIHDELRRRGSDRALYWAVSDYSVQLPESAIPVLLRSREWWELLARASYFVHNCGTPGPLRRRDDQVVVQTWHGTPLKLLGYDRPLHQAKVGAVKSISTMSARWSYMIAQNTYSAETFRRAYLYAGTMLEVGYPRNDSLVGASADQVAAIRQRLQIAPDQKAVLYAPTWRDGDASVVGYLDLEALRERLGPDYVFLLRGHTNTLRNAPRRTGSGLIDVTSYPLINDLFLAADVTITDYSSIMFDYSVTGKPLLFYVPDLDDYRDRRRGMYFDLAASAPGPLLTSPELVAESLQSLDRVAEDYADRYAAWRTRFNPRDDGHAAARVVDAVFGDS
ncbi:CDP-glycerol glycerophosphotransferase (TagB/SpsB family) [Microlunatus panaciterrae]|uniref:CDP-glycerol glycerophosphotransferase (TagB/SpsB family) n=1 Tax=Microlunatus panaciterrae TaxID=400768 RepID=A0ABS2RDX5_9ACTN|nr:CDP-glycerol glycerophosphotransferase (TagB/SpsB family) [Microlunatus panaciterrae]